MTSSHSERQRALDAAAARYRRAYNRGYNLSERAGSKAECDRAQAILDKANRDYAAAKAAYGS